MKQIGLRGRHMPKPPPPPIRQCIDRSRFEVCVWLSAMDINKSWFDVHTTCAEAVHNEKTSFSPTTTLYFIHSIGNSFTEMSFAFFVNHEKSAIGNPSYQKGNCTIVILITYHLLTCWPFRDQHGSWSPQVVRLEPSGGSRIFPRGVRQLPKVLLFFNFFAENCMKMKEFGPPEGARPWCPPWIRQWNQCITVGHW